jgi:hypothetical protein
MISELAVVVRIHDLLAAIPTAEVTGLVLASEATTLRPASPGGPGLVEANGGVFASWDLGELLGLPPVEHAWVMLGVRHGHSTLRLALRTGPCLVVEQMPATVRVPARVLTVRAAGVLGAFRGKGRGAYGLALDPQRLLTEDELRASVDLEGELGS